MVPIDAPLLVAAALALAVALRGSKMPSWLVTTLRPLAYPMILLGIVALVVSLEDVHMLRRLGEPKGFYVSTPK